MCHRIERQHLGFSREYRIQKSRILRATGTRKSGKKNFGRQSLSMIIAIPIPPPIYMVAKPLLRFLRFISCINVTMSLVPVQPIGWPKAIPPPFTLVLSRSMPSSLMHAIV